MSTRHVKWLSPAERLEVSSDFEVADRGVIVPVGMASEVLVPWHRVLEIWDARDAISRD